MVSFNQSERSILEIDQSEAWKPVTQSGEGAIAHARHCATELSVSWPLIGQLKCYLVSYWSKRLTTERLLLCHALHP